MDALITQYTNYNQRRLHYSTLFWACLALHFSGMLIVLIFASSQAVFTLPVLFILVGLSSFLMAFITLRLHRLEVHYEVLLRQIEDFWLAKKIEGIQRADITNKMSSRKLVIVALFFTALGFFGFGIANLY